MVRPLMEKILWQLERKRKYRWSCGTNRTCTIAKAVTFIALMGLVYLSICSVLSGTKLDFLDKVSQVLDLEQQQQQYHRSDHYAYKNFRSKINISMNESNAEFLNEVHPMALDIIHKLGSIFAKADTDKNSFLDAKELAKWINDRVMNHFTQALKSNFDHYFEIDENPRNGLVSWEEYIAFFFKNRNIKGVTADDVRNRTPKFNELPRDIKVDIARIQASWSEAASNNPDFLTVDEFLAFEHPEVSPTKILAQVQDTFVTFDLDGDGVISKMEFDTTYREAEGVDQVYRNDKKLIDTDGNGEITRVELMRYMDPRNIVHSEKDAKELLKVADKDRDERLSLLEIMQSADFVVKSKLYDADRNLHSHD